jgi:hypothetical protein
MCELASQDIAKAAYDGGRQAEAGRDFASEDEDSGEKCHYEPRSTASRTICTINTEIGK